MSQTTQSLHHPKHQPRSQVPVPPSHTNTHNRTHTRKSSRTVLFGSSRLGDPTPPTLSDGRRRRDADGSESPQTTASTRTNRERCRSSCSSTGLRAARAAASAVVVVGVRGDGVVIERGGGAEHCLANGLVELVLRRRSKYSVDGDAAGSRSTRIVCNARNALEHLTVCDFSKAESTSQATLLSTLTRSSD